MTLPFTPLPRDLPIRPLGRDGERYFFLTAQGQMRVLSATGLEKRANIVDLFVGCGDPDRWLGQIGPSKRKRDDGSTWNPSVACDWLMAACAARPLFDPETPVRSYGTWRGEGGAAVANTGAHLHHALGVIDPAGDIIGGAIYPAAPGRGAPADDPADPGEVRAILTEVAALWSWARPTDADAWLGWVGLAMLGAFPDWRPHLWVTGRRGSGKSELMDLAHRLLGPMSPGVLTNVSEAGLRQSANDQARPFLLDEAESGHRAEDMGEVLRLFRHMSGGEGSRVVRGSANHVAVTFRLVGSGYLSSILSVELEPQDRSRFVMLGLGALPRDADARRLDRLARRAASMGPALWRRMLWASPRWDAAWARWRALARGLGADSRDAATVGAILAGWDLMLHDGPDEAREDLARAIAAPLVADALAAAEEGEGEKCLRRIMASLIQKGGGGTVPVFQLVSDLLDGMAGAPDAPLDSRVDQQQLRTAGMRMARDPASGRPCLWIVSGAHPWLDRALAGTRWAAGGHRQALLMLDGVAPHPAPQRIGAKQRVLVIPAAHLPDGV